jgi:hypothetical protein
MSVQGSCQSVKLIRADDEIVEFSAIFWGVAIQEAPSLGRSRNGNGTAGTIHAGGVI